MFLTSLLCMMHNLVSMAVHLLWLLLVGSNPQDISLDSNNVNAHKISVRVSDNGDLDA